MFAVQGVECPEEGGEGFAGAGGGDDEGVVAVADALPGAFLGGGGCAEGGTEPVAYGGGEMGECVGHVSIMGGVYGVRLLNCWGWGRKMCLTEISQSM